MKEGGPVGMRCPDCDVELEPVDEKRGDPHRPADHWTCPVCGARWNLEHSLMIEAD